MWSRIRRFAAGCYRIVVNRRNAYRALRLSTAACALVLLALTPTSVDAVPVSKRDRATDATTSSRSGAAAAVVHRNAPTGAATVDATPRRDRAGAFPRTGSGSAAALAADPFARGPAEIDFVVAANASAPNWNGSGNSNPPAFLGTRPSAAAFPGVAGGADAAGPGANSADNRDPNFPIGIGLFAGSPLLIGSGPVAAAMRRAATAILAADAPPSSDPAVSRRADSPSETANNGAGGGKHGIARGSGGNGGVTAPINGGDDGVPVNDGVGGGSVMPGDPATDPAALTPTAYVPPTDGFRANGPMVKGSAPTTTVPGPDALSILLPGLLAIGVLQYRKRRARPAAAGAR
jgi:hypothetical protein